MTKLVIIELNVVKKNIEPFDVYEADEAFLTSTPFCLIPAVKLNGLKIGDGKPGKITQSLLKKWGEQSASYRVLHNRSYRKYKWLTALFTIPVIIISTLTK